MGFPVDQPVQYASAGIKLPVKSKSVFFLSFYLFISFCETDTLCFRYVRNEITDITILSLHLFCLVCEIMVPDTTYPRGKFCGSCVEQFALFFQMASLYNKNTFKCPAQLSQTTGGWWRLTEGTLLSSASI